MSTPREIILAHGGSFDGAKNRAGFWLPHEVVHNPHAFVALQQALIPLNRRIKISGDDRDAWIWTRFVGEGRRRTDCRTFRVYDVGATNNVDPHLIVTIWKNGAMEIREKGRKTGFKTTVCATYIRCMKNAALQLQLEKARAKKAKKKARR